MSRRRIEGLYPITPETSDEDWLCARVEAVLSGGARVIQYRAKSCEVGLRRQQAGRLLQLCRARGALLIVNDDVGLAQELGADGVHLGRDDTPPAVARATLGEGALIGVSCYDSLTRARQAQDGGADYVAFGSFFPSQVKPSAVRAPIELLRAARATLDLPVVAIGGITAENGRALVEAGADALAVISALFDASDSFSAAQALAALFEAQHEALPIGQDT
ncbi:MAG TPA: thiamine phosphate synthase [Burkholderiales bacterium]|nr:thiamine phosphate synthase [Burkholderiales bacterium]